MCIRDSYKNAREFRYGPITRDTPVLCDRHIRYHGQPIAAVFAETQEEADGAALLIRASCKETPGVFTPEEALAEGAPLVHPTGNITSRTAIEKGDIDQALSLIHICPLCSRAVKSHDPGRKTG